MPTSSRMATSSILHLCTVTQVSLKDKTTVIAMASWGGVMWLAGVPMVAKRGMKSIRPKRRAPQSVGHFLFESIHRKDRGK